MLAKIKKIILSKKPKYINIKEQKFLEILKKLMKYLLLKKILKKLQ